VLHHVLSAVSVVRVAVVVLRNVVKAVLLHLLVNVVHQAVRHVVRLTHNLTSAPANNR
jgi:hypothetical protein